MYGKMSFKNFILVTKIFPSIDSEVVPDIHIVSGSQLLPAGLKDL